MKVLMINSVCGIRSTGRICTDLADELRQNGHEVLIAYGRENVPERYRDIAYKFEGKWSVMAHGVLARLFDGDGRGSVLATLRLIKRIKQFDPDVVHLHNLHGYYINFGILFRYLAKVQKKVIWTLHDMWAFTGHSAGCAVFACEKWETGCSHCPGRSEYPKSFLDRSRANFRRKKKLVEGVRDLTVVTPSKWLADLAARSFLAGKKILAIPNGIDTELFSPRESDVKEKLGIKDKTMLMGCASAWTDQKGLPDFRCLAEKLDPSYAVVLVGLAREQIAELPKNIMGIERTDTVRDLADLYSAADLFVNLTYQDNYPTVNIEALSCGTPVLTYRTGGSPECLDGQNGVAFDTGDLDGVVRFLNEEFRPGCFTVTPREHWKKSYAVACYAKLYETL